MSDILQALGLSPINSVNLTKTISVALKSSTGHNAKATIIDGEAEFTSPSESSVYKLTVAANPKRNREGTPSPTNPISFGGWRAATITNAGKEETETVTIEWNSAGDVYRGILDVTSGILTSTWKLVKLRNAEDFGLSSDGTTVVCMVSFTDRKKNSAEAGVNLECNIAKTSWTAIAGEVTCSWISRTNNRCFFRGIELSDLQNAATSIGVEILYELAVPATFTLDPATVKIFSGTNRVSADCGPITELIY